MSTYTIYLNTTASVAVTVEADDYEAAVEQAYEIVPHEVCAQCGGWGKDYGLDLGEWDVDEEEHVVDGEVVRPS